MAIRPKCFFEFSLMSKGMIDNTNESNTKIRTFPDRKYELISSCGCWAGGHRLENDHLLTHLTGIFNKRF